MTIISRKNFLKISLLGLIGAGFSPGFQTKQTRRIQGLIGRIAADDKIIPVYQEPSYDSEVVRETVFDELLHLYFEQEIIPEESSPQRWYRVWGGYLPGAYVQQTRYRLNQLVSSIPECGRLAEITVPYTEAFTFSKYAGWKKKYRLYYGTTHWLTGIDKGPDGKNWYELTSQLYSSLVYYIRREHLRPIQDVEYLPTSIQVPPEQKQIKISLKDQTLTAFEGEKLVFNTKISSGLGYNEVSLKNPYATATPKGTFFVTSKYPSKHMGSVIATDATESYILPGVPWTTFFIYDTGVAFHGTYWHNNFGNKMSHGCINMRNCDAKWVFRWVNPAYDPPYKNHCDWHNTGHGTRINID